MSHKLHILPMIASIAMTVVTIGVSVSPAYANRGAPDYRLTLEQAASGTKVARETLWRCGTEGCTASSGTSRPEITCAHAVREVGKVTSFSFKGEAFDADALAKCNAKAR